MTPFSANSNPANQPPNVLLVDDEEDIVTILSMQLKNAGYRLMTAHSGQEALQLFEQHNFDLLVTDAMMPQMSGYDLVKIVRAKENGKVIPIIMLTALSGESDALEAFKIGVDDFVTKPYNPGVLKAKIASLLISTNPKAEAAVVRPSALVPVSGNSGLPALDTILGGKWPSGSNILLLGEFGSGKSSFANSFLQAGMQQGDSAMMITVDNTPAQVRAQLEAITGGKLADYEAQNKFRLVDAASWSGGYATSAQERFAITGNLELTGLAGAIMDAGAELGQTIAKKGGGRRVIDSISSLFVYFDLPTVQRFLLGMARTAVSYGGVSTLFLLETGSVDERTLNNIKYFMDGIFEFRRESDFEMRVSNFKWQNCPKEWFKVTY